MKIDKIVVGPLQENCYILTKNNKVIIIDPGDEYSKIKEKINGEVIAILITHSHFDHVGALEELHKEYFSPIYQNENLKEQDYEIEDFKFKVIKTYGHTNDSVTYYFYEENIMFTGDFIFKESVGRTDLPTGNINEMNMSIQKISEYSDDILIYPGHGDSTTLGYEKKNNYYFN